MSKQDTPAQLPGPHPGDRIRGGPWALLGWVGVGTLFVVFHILFFTNQLKGLLWVTLLSVGPLWLLTAAGGLVELRGILARFGRKESP